MLRRACLVAAFVGIASAALAADQPPSLILLTLDTTRADYVGRTVGGKSLTPNLDALARSGARFTNALAPAPLTLPAHCSLMTGLNPPEHGVRDNGVSALPADVPTLAAVLAARGYDTAAFVSSRVLDRRFGLARGFAVYDDAMVAERTGEQGYPERGAEAVTDAALAWAAAAPRDRPYFLWVHYYDPHAPYDPPGDWKRASRDERYAGEVAYMDREIGRLLGKLPASPGGRVVAAVGDHGEMLGEHGEKEHGIFVYRSALRVPLMIAGPGLAAGRSIEQRVATRSLPGTLLALLGLTAEARPFGASLAGFLTGTPPAAAPIYSESLLPESAYGWSPLAAATDERYRFILAPRPELYDLQNDPAEARNLFASRREDARRLQKVILENQAKARSAVPVASAELAESLRRLGYLSGSSPRRGSGMDPKDGIVLLDEFDRAKSLIRAGMPAEAVRQLALLVEKNPGNVPFLVRLGEAQVAAGQPEAALKTLEAAVALSPQLDFLHAHLARIHTDARRYKQARAEWEATLELNPRYALAWLGLAGIASRDEGVKAELAVLRKGEAAGTRSAAILTRMAEIELSSGEIAQAEGHAALAVQLMPEVPAAWQVAADVAEKQGNRRVAIERLEKFLRLAPSDPSTLVRLGILLIGSGRASEARPILERAAALGGQSPSGEAARRLLREIP
jgi:choline-sulfatase